MEEKEKNQTMKEDRKAQARKRYEEKRKAETFLLAVHLPKAWKQKGIGPAVRNLIKALVKAERKSHHRKPAIGKLLDSLAAQVNQDE